MNLGWVAGALRGRALAGRRLGNVGVQSLAARGSFSDALDFLGASSYGHRVRGDMDLASAQRAVADTGLWHLRVLAGWLPPAGVQAIRRFAAWFELLDIESHAAALAAGGRWGESPYALGALAGVWGRVAPTSTLAGLRSVLARSAFGDPGGDSLAEIFLGLRLGWSRQIRDVMPQAREWGDGGLALALAKALFAGDAVPGGVARPQVPELGVKWAGATDFAGFAAVMPASARWVLDGIHEAADLWRAEERWWERVDRDAAALLRHPQLGRTVVVAAGALLVTDCWRTQAALEQAARGSASRETAHAAA